MTEYFTKDGDDYVKVSDTLLKQADVDSVVESRLERERKKFSDYDDLKATAAKVGTIETEYKSKLEEKDNEINTIKGDLGKQKLETEKVKIVHKYKLSDDLHEFVVGDTVEDMEKRAEKLSKGITGGGVVIDKDKKPDEKASSSKQIAGKLFGKKSDD